ncbi:MAG: transcription antitermination factor NusB [Acidimicrobiia bacterium]
MPTQLERVRHRARKSALMALYCADLTGVDALTCLAQQDDLEAPVEAFSRTLVEGVEARRDELDAEISDVAEHWTIDRMPPIDRAILRLALFELVGLPDVPEGASINEAVELAKCYSTTDSSRFVNGLLGRLATRAVEAGRR